MILFYDLVICNTSVLIPYNVSQWVSIARTVQESGQHGFVTLFVCFPESIVGFVIYSLPFSGSVSSSTRRIFLDHIIRIDTLFNCRFLSEGCRHLPQVQCTMPISQFCKQSWHCTLEVISHISKYSVFPMLRVNSFVFSLNRLNFLVLF